MGVALTAVLLLPSASQAQTTWTNTASDGNWSGSTNWSPVTTNGPSGAGAIVNLTSNISSNRIVTLDIGRTVGVLNIGDSNGSSIFQLTNSGGAALTLDNNAAAAQINFVASGKAANAIFAPMVLTGDLNITNSTSGDQRIQGNIDSLTATTKTITFTSESTGELRFQDGFANTITSGTINIVNNATNGTINFNNVNRNLNGTTITNNAGTLSVSTGANNVLGTAFLQLNSGTLSIRGGSAVRNITNNYAIGGNIALATEANQTMTLSGSGSLGGTSRTVSVTSPGSGLVQVSGTLSGSGGLVKEGAGTLRYDTTNSKTYTGGTVINEGTLLLANGAANFNVFANAATAHVTINNGAILDSQGTQGLGIVTLNAGSIIDSSAGITNVINASGYVVQSGTISAHIAGDGATLTKNGIGAVSLDASATYTGQTTINAGTLLLGSSGSISSTSLGFGVNNSSSGVLQVENSSFSFSDHIQLALASVSIDSGSWNLFTGSAFTAGDLSLTSLTSDIVGLTFSESGGVWSGMEGSRTWSFDESSGVLSVVPEASTIGLITMGLATVLFFRKRRVG